MNNSLLMKLNIVSNEVIVKDLIDMHNNIRSGKIDDARILLECLLNNMIFEWRTHVKFPKQPSC